MSMLFQSRILFHPCTVARRVIIGFCSTWSWLHGQHTASTLLQQKQNMRETTPTCSYCHFYYQGFSTTRYGYPSLDIERPRATTGFLIEALSLNRLTEKATGLSNQLFVSTSSFLLSCMILFFLIKSPNMWLLQGWSDSAKWTIVLHFQLHIVNCLFLACLEDWWCDHNHVASCRPGRVPLLLAAPCSAPPLSLL